MLPGCSSGVDKALIVSRLKIVRERAADLPQDLEWSDGLGPGVGVLQQRGERLAGVGVGDRTSRLHPMRLSMEVSNAASCAVPERLDNVQMFVTTRHLSHLFRFCLPRSPAYRRSLVLAFARLSLHACQ